MAMRGDFRCLPGDSQAMREESADLIEEAPIGCIGGDLDPGFLCANRAAMDVLGLRPDQAGTTFGGCLSQNSAGTMSREHFMHRWRVGGIRPALKLRMTGMVSFVACLADAEGRPGRIVQMRSVLLPRRRFEPYVIRLWRRLTPWSTMPMMTARAS